MQIFFIGLIGLCVGSFLNVCIDRIPKGRSVVAPPSSCEACGRRLGFLDLVPVISYLWLRGRCRYCGARISLRLPLVELATCALFVVLGVRYGVGAFLIVPFLYAALFITILFIDLENRIIPNKIIYPALPAVLVLSLFWQGPGLKAALLGGVAGFLLFLLLFVIYRGGMGAGDVKLAGLIGLAVGFPQVMVALLLAVVSGGVVALLVLVLRIRGRKDPIPFGPFLALGAMATLWWGQPIQNWYFGLFR